jgi:RDD family
LRFSPAGVSARIVAAALDSLLGACVVLITMMLWSQKGLAQIQAMAEEQFDELEPALLAAKVAGLAMPFLFALQVARTGASPGKVALSLSVRNVADGGFPTYRRALAREALRFIHVMPFVLPGILVPFVVVASAVVIGDLSRNRLAQTWYDRLMRTVIVTPVPETS